LLCAMSMPSAWDKLATANGVTPRYADAAELLADEELDAIGMAVGPALHGELGIQALSRGLPCL
jgi:predicted dehydrogenase